MNELMLDSTNLKSIEQGLKTFPVVGVTSNPNFLAKEGKIDLFTRLSEMRKLVGAERSLHVQVVSTTTNAIIKEAEYILEKLDKDVYIKIPVTNEGLPAIKELRKRNINVTATGICSVFQAIMAIMAGVNYAAIYYNMMEQNGVDAEDAVYRTRSFIDNSNSPTKIVVANFRNSLQIINAYNAGAHATTVKPEMLHDGLDIPVVANAVSAFTRNFEGTFGASTTMLSF